MAMVAADSGLRVDEWIGVDTVGGSLSARIAPVLYEASQSFSSQGNRQRQSAVNNTRITTFVPPDTLDEDNPYYVDDLIRELKDQVFAGIKPYARIRDQADVPGFFYELGAPPLDGGGWPGPGGRRLDVFAFIGHAVQAPSTYDPAKQSVGLRVNPSDYSTYVWLMHARLMDAAQTLFCGEEIQPGQQAPECNPTHNLWLPDGFSNFAKIVFIASCNVGDLFKSMWLMPSANSNRAIVLPSSPISSTAGRVGLRTASLAWKIIAADLLSGKSIDYAVRDANTQIEQAGAPDRWQYFGDPNAHIR